MTYKAIALSVGRNKKTVTCICDSNAEAARIEYRQRPKVVARSRAYELRPKTISKRTDYKATQAHKKRQKDLEGSPKWVSTRKIYRESAHGKAVRKTYSQSPAGKIRLQKWREKITSKLSHSLRRRLRRAIKGGYKAGSVIRDLGCTIDELKTYLGEKFEEGMTWDNWAFDGWHIDHIRPLASFDLADREQFLQACHYTNLQPLWAKENMAKGSKY